MTTAAKDLVDRLQTAGVEIWLDGDNLRVRGALSRCADDIDELERRKGEVMTFLRETIEERDQGGPRYHDRLLRDQTGAELIVQRPHPAFAQVADAQFAHMLEIDRYLDRSDDFDAMIGSAQDHHWDPGDSRYIDYSTPFDTASEPLIAESEFLCLSAPSVRACLSDAASRARFINKVVWIRLSNLLHGEQGGLNLSASLCGVLKDQAAQEFAANQAREEARHVSGLSKYIRLRWGRPAPCMPALREFLTDIIETPDVTKKILGLQVMVEGLAMGTMGSLFRKLRDPVARRLIQLMMTDEAFHHKFGKLWIEKTLPTLSSAERQRLEDWTGYCLKTFVMKMNPPLELQILKHDYALSPHSVLQEMKDQSGESADLDPLGAGEIFRVLTNSLAKPGLMNEETKQLYQAFVAHDGTLAIDPEYQDIVQAGIEYLGGINRARRTRLPDAPR